MECFYFSHLGILKFLLCNLKDVTQKLQLFTKKFLWIFYFKILNMKNKACWRQRTTNLDWNFKPMSNRGHGDLKKKNIPYGFFVLETKGHIDIKHETETKKKKALSKILKKGRFLNRYNFDYAGRDTVN